MLERSRKYKRIGSRLIEELEEFDYIKDSPVRIVFLTSDELKKKQNKLVLGECIKVNKNYQWCCKYDFMIVVYEPNCFEFTKEQYEILIRHELHHVGINQDGNEPSYFVVPHDVEEFWDIINENGLDWDLKG